MVGIQELLVAVANTPKDTPVVVDVANNGRALMPITSVEVKDGRLVIACSVPKGAGARAKTEARSADSATLPTRTDDAVAAATAATVTPAAEKSENIELS
jgi:hypothetical protein